MKKTFNFDLVKILESESKEKIWVTENLYIFIDDERKKLKYDGKGKNYWIRSIKFCTGKKNGKLINKRWITIHFPLKKKFNQIELYSLIMQKLNQFFIFNPKQIKLIFGPDGAKTFNKIKFLLSKTFYNFIFILDSYHFS